MSCRNVLCVRFEIDYLLDPFAPQMDIPEQYRRYACTDYFADGWSAKGHFDEHSQTLLIAPFAKTYEDTDASFFAIGRSGCDGIDFGYRVGHAGLWAYYPITREFKFMSDTVAELVAGWCAGRLSV